MSIVTAKRAKEIETTRCAELATADKKAISIAPDEIFDREVETSNIDA